MSHIAKLSSDGPHQHRLRDAYEIEREKKKRYNKLKGRIKWNMKKKKKESGIDQKGYHERHQKESSAVWQHALNVNFVQ